MGGGGKTGWGAMRAGHCGSQRAKCKDDSSGTQMLEEDCKPPEPCGYQSAGHV
jgi:hypothetical protein